MSKVLIDRELAERVCHVDNSTRQTARRELRTILATPSGTPEMPVKAYYHERTDLEGVRTRSVGLEVRKEFTDAPLVLEADALARIAGLEGEIAKRDAELAACRVAVENCEVFRARIVELESRYQRDVYGLNNEGDPIGGDPAGGYANDNARLRSELAAIKAQEPVLPCELDLESSFSCAEKEASLHAGVRDTFYFALIECLQKNKLYRAPAQKELSVVMPERKKAHNCEGIEFWKANGWNDCLDELASIYAAPVSEAKAQGVVQWPDADEIMQMAFEEGQPADDASGYYFELEEFDLFIERLISEVARLNAAPAQHPKCKTCDDNGMIGGPSFYAPDDGGEPCPDCSAPVQKASVPDDFVCDSKPLQELLNATAMLLETPCPDSATYWAAQLANVEQLLAAPAAPAADAGLVDMYRHLQTVTPYRFKKIQDASVTDGGDVLYFHKDRFDAALLDDMAANCAKESK